MENIEMKPIITEAMVTEWLEEQDDETIFEIYEQINDDVHRRKDLDYIMRGHGCIECIQLALAGGFDPEDDWFKYEGYQLTSSDYMYDLIYIPDLSYHLIHGDAECSKYDDWVASLANPKHTEEEIKEKALKYLRDELEDGELVRYRKALCADDEIYPMYCFCDFAKKESLADVVRRLVMTLATYGSFFDCDFFFVTDSALVPWSRETLTRKIVELCYAEQDKLGDTFSDEFKKIFRGDF